MTLDIEKLASRVMEQEVTLQWLVEMIGPLLEGRSVRVKRSPTQRAREGIVESYEKCCFKLRMGDGSTCWCSMYEIEQVYS